MWANWSCTFTMHVINTHTYILKTLFLFVRWRALHLPNNFILLIRVLQRCPSSSQTKLLEIWILLFIFQNLIDAKCCWKTKIRVPCTEKKMEMRTQFVHRKEGASAVCMCKICTSKYSGTSNIICYLSGFFRLTVPRTYVSNNNLHK